MKANSPDKPQGKYQKRKSQRMVYLCCLLALAITLALASGAYRFYAEDSAPAQAGAEVPVLSSGGESLTDPTAWNLMLVNPWHSLPSDHRVALHSLGDGQAVDQRCYASLQSMLEDCAAAGCQPHICSSYRTQAKQETLYNDKVQEFLAQGYTQARATAQAEEYVAKPGFSEHQLGLAVDIVDVNYQILDEAQETTAVQQWLLANSWRYGFILRYPTAKHEITGIMYEPWHYRYVGEEAAAEIYNQGLCLEEYLATLT